ncbi:hypothetical protein PINS_up011059 [Pythium insidiosum]|nr:hypothetical protein PINS_up011059 [Pythium insidiosum]
MTQGYKDECDTLREALQIAAQAVAEATMLGFIPSDEQEPPTSYSVDANALADASATDTAAAVVADSTDIYEDAAGWPAGDSVAEMMATEAILMNDEEDEDGSEFTDALD